MLPESPRHADGTHYAFEVIYGSVRGYADDWADLCTVLISGYATLAPDEQLRRRMVFAASAQVHIQAGVLQRFDAELAQLPAADQQVLMQSRAVPITLERWDHPVPLVLIRTLYAPFGTQARPIGVDLGTGEPSILWLDPSTEAAFVLSLTTAGYIRVGQS